MISLVGTHPKEAGHTLLELIRRHQRSSPIRAPCAATAAASTEREEGRWPDHQHKAAAGKIKTGREIIDEEKRTGPRTDPCGISMRTRKEQLA